MANTPISDPDKYIEYNLATVILIFTAAAVLTIFQAYTLKKTLEKNMQIMSSVLTLAIVSNFCLCWFEFSFYSQEKVKYGDQSDDWISQYKSMIYGNYLYVVAVDTSHWIFAMQYYTTAKSLQYHLEHRDPSSIRKKEKILHSGMGVAVLILTIVSILLANNTNSKEIYGINIIVKSLITLFITVVVIVSLWVVHKVTKENEGLISNHKEIYILVAAFVLYSCSNLFIILTLDNSNCQFLIAGIVWVLCIFVSEGLLTLIIVRLSNQQQKVQENSWEFEKAYKKLSFEKIVNVNDSQRNMILKTIEQSQDNILDQTNLHEVSVDDFSQDYASKVNQTTFQVDDLNRINDFLNGVYVGSNRNILQLLLQPSLQDQEAMQNQTNQTLAEHFLGSFLSGQGRPSYP